MKDIQEITDIQQMVDTFYGKVRQDDLLKDIFNGRIGDRWPEHLDKMYRFWQTVLLEEHTYQGSPFPPHLRMPVAEEHFERWKMLFNETVYELFDGERADRAKWQGSRMAAMFLSKINYFRENNLTPIV